MSETLRETLLPAILRQVPFDGWSWRALHAAAAEIGLDPSAVERAFPRGPRDAIAYWNADADRRMLAALAVEDLDAMPIRQRIASAVRARLQVNRAHREALRLALAHAALPGNAVAAARAIHASVDAMWRTAGDTATDFNYYTKRALLAAVYGATTLYWLDDRSEDFAATWAFLDRRITDVMKVPKAMARLRACLPDLGRLARCPRPSRAA